MAWTLWTEISSVITDSKVFQIKILLNLMNFDLNSIIGLILFRKIVWSRWVHCILSSTDHPQCKIIHLQYKKSQNPSVKDLIRKWIDFSKIKWMRLCHLKKKNQFIDFIVKKIIKYHRIIIDNWNPWVSSNQSKDYSRGGQTLRVQICIRVTCIGSQYLHKPKE